MFSKHVVLTYIHLHVYDTFVCVNVTYVYKTV